MSAGVFISYRRGYAQHAAGRLKDDLAEAFDPTTRIFRDIEDIEPGLDFTQSLDKALRSSAVMLVLIGPGWLDLKDAQGRRRLEQPNDWVRLEVATALKRDIRVVPVLLEGAPLPAAEDLPADLQPLALRQWFELADSRWRGDVQRLVDALAKVPGMERRVVPGPTPAPQPAPPAPPAPKSNLKTLLTGTSLGVVGLLVVAGLFFEEQAEPLFMPDVVPAPSPVSAPSPAPSLAPAPAPTAVPAAVAPDVAGLWRTATGEVYHFEQDGRSVRFTAEAGGQAIGQGRGQFEGDLLRLAMTLQVQGVFMGNANCDLQPAQDGRSFTGLCNGPNGPFPAQMFR